MQKNTIMQTHTSGTYTRAIPIFLVFRSNRSAGDITFLCIFLFAPPSAFFAPPKSDVFLMRPVQ
jgi:hypothetical protein